MFNEKPESQQRAELTAEREIDSLRRALSISDEIARDYRKEVERLTAVVAHLREGIGAYEYQRSGGDETGALLADWRERDRTKTPQQTTEGKPHAG